MMSSERRTDSKDFKQEAVRLYETSGKSAREIEQDLDITPGMLQKWRARLRQEGEQAFPGKGHQAAAAEAGVGDHPAGARHFKKSHRSLLT